MIETPVREAAIEARSRLAREWASFSPVSPEQIADFYRDSQALADDIEAFHTDPERQGWTRAIVYLAQTQGIQSVVDIGCGAGHDLAALREALPAIALIGVEPNKHLRQRCGFDGGATSWRLTDNVAFAPVESADLLLCIDVLEHLPDPEAFLAGVAQRAKMGAWMVEATATHDAGTPLHLKTNQGWEAGRALERAGWERLQSQGRFHVWRRVRAASFPRATLMLCANRSVSLPTFRSVLQLVEAERDAGWRVYLGGEAGIHRARNMAASRWYTQTADDVFVMVDDDITFTPHDITRLVERCRNGYPVICAAYAKRDASNVALRGKFGELYFSETVDLEPVEIESMATGFVAVHRQVLDALIPSLPLCHAGSGFAHWPMFDFETVQNEAGDWEHLSEDYYFSKIARAHGFKTYVDPTIILGHLGTFEITLRNMVALHAATKGG